MGSVLKYYAFDWDDNILHMETPIHVNYCGKLIDISPKKYAKLRKNPKLSLHNRSFEEFRDYGPRGSNGFITDVNECLKNQKYGPSWGKFTESLLEGSIIMIVTARGHEPSTIKKAIKIIIEHHFNSEQKNEMVGNIKTRYNIEIGNNNEIINWYLSQCMFMGVCSKSFSDTFNVIRESVEIEVAKEMILKHFIDQINIKNDKFILGFSDDDKNNIRSIKRLFKTNRWSNAVGLYIYDTSNPGKTVKTLFN